jgi:hypothetical protein
MRPLAILIAAAMLACTTGAAAYDPIVTKRGWTRVDLYDDGLCAGEIGTNGKFYVITVLGFEPGETARFRLTNGNMKPIDREVRINRQGGWQEYYIPFRFAVDADEARGALVNATLTGSRCRVPLSFTWSRTKGWAEPAPLRNPYR